MIAERGRPVKKMFIIDHVQGGQRRRAGKQVAAHGVGVRPPPHVQAGREHSGAYGEAGPQGLGRAQDVGYDVEVLHPPHPSGAAHASLDLVVHQQDPVPPADRGDLLHEPRRRDDIAALALHRLHEQGRNLLGRNVGLKVNLLDDAGAVGPAGGGLHSVSAPIAIRVGHVDRPRDGGEEPFPMRGPARRERQGTHRPSVEGTQEGDEAPPAGVPAGQLHGGFDALGAAVAKEHLPLALSRHGSRQAAGQIDLAGVIEVGPGEMKEPLGLLLHGPHHPRMAVAYVQHRDPAGEVYEVVAVHVPHHSPGGALGHHWRGLGRGRHVPVVLLHHLAGTGPRRLYHDVDVSWHDLSPGYRPVIISHLGPAACQTLQILPAPTANRGRWPSGPQDHG